MIAVIFEVWPAGGAEGSGADRYFELAGQLREQVEEVDGFISVERFRSLTEDGKFVSLSFWRDEAAVAAWYATTDHKAAQAEGRAGVFRDYRIRVAGVLRDYDMASGRP